MAKKAFSISKEKLTAVRAARLIILIAIAALLAWTAFSLRSDFNSEGIQRLRYYFSDLLHGGLRFSECGYDRDLETLCAPLGGGMGVYSGDTYSFVSDLGSRDRTQLRYLEPTLSRSGDYLLIYDRGGSGVFLTTSYGVMLNRHVDGEILYAEVNPSGHITAVTNEPGSRAVLTVYDKSLGVRFKWQTPDHYILSCALSGDGRTVYALCLSAEGERMSSTLRVFDVAGRRDTRELVLPPESLRLVCDRSSLYVLCAGGLYRLENDGFEPLAEYDRLLVYSLRSGEKPAVCVGRGIEIRLIVPGEFDTVYKEAPVSCDYSDGNLAMLFPNELIVRASESVRQYHVPGARSVALSKNGPVLFYSDRAQRVTEGSNE